VVVLLALSLPRSGSESPAKPAQIDTVNATASQPIAVPPSKPLPVPVPSLVAIASPKPITEPALTQATKEKPFENSLGMKFVPVPITGGPTDGKTVLFSVWETRVKDYARFAKDEKREWPKPDFAQTDDHPAVNVSSEDATAYCAWLTKEDQSKRKIGPKDVYRLPTDHEWSCAMGIGKDEDAALAPVAKDVKIQTYPWGPKFPPPKGAGNYYGRRPNRTRFSHGRRSPVTTMASTGRLRRGALPPMPLVFTISVEMFGNGARTGSTRTFPTSVFRVVVRFSAIRRTFSGLRTEIAFRLRLGTTTLVSALCWSRRERQSSHPLCGEITGNPSCICTKPRSCDKGEAL